MNEPKKPADPPPTSVPNPRVTQDGGVPEGAEDADAKGTPNSDRQDTETAPAR